MRSAPSGSPVLGPTPVSVVSELASSAIWKGLSEEELLPKSSAARIWSCGSSGELESVTVGCSAVPPSVSVAVVLEVVLVATRSSVGFSGLPPLKPIVPEVKVRVLPAMLT